AYDANGSVTAVTDPAGNTSRMTYNEFGQPLTISDALGNTTVNTYDGQGNLTTTKAPLTVPTSFTYYPHGDLFTVTRGGATTTYEYDAVGRPTAVTDAASVRRTTSYDANGNATGTSFTWVNPDPPGDQRTLATTNVYDAGDRLITAIDPEGH